VPTTLGEAFGLFVFEALAMGVPVVLPRDGAFTELVETTGGGVLCEPDDVESLAGALQKLLADPQGAREVGMRGREAIRERFTVEHTAQETVSVFEAAVKNG
jgi:glycosyltransferase involved in cell wall biosynthesis